MAYATTVKRHKTREVGLGDHIVGGEHPIWVQSMTTTNTFEAEATLAQIQRLEEAGCENAELLDHLRGPGPHVRGCFVLDLLLGKT